MMHRFSLLRAPRWALIVWAGALVMAVVVLVVVATSGRETDATWEKVQAEGALLVGMDASYAPFEVVDANGDFSGYDVDLARALAAGWGVEAQFVNVHFDGLCDALQTGRCDIIISALPYDQTRTRDVSYSQAYFDAGEVLLVRRGGEVQQVDDLDGRRVAVELGSEGHQQMLLQARNKGLMIDILAVQSAEELALICEDTTVDAIACDRVLALELVSACSVWDLAQELSSEPFVIAVMPKAHMLLEETDSALERLNEEGFFQDLAIRWFGAGG